MMLLMFLLCGMVLVGWEVDVIEICFLLLRLWCHLLERGESKQFLMLQ